jgi:hypothetical protein
LIYLFTGHGLNQENFANTLRSLPIWPLHSSENKFIDAKSGKLLPFKLPFFSFDQNTEFYKCERETDFKALTILGATLLNELEYVKKYIIPKLEGFQTPSQEYINFLRNILSSGNQEIEKYLREYRAIPNRSLTAFVRADALYDSSVSLFNYVFKDSDKFLPEIFYSNNNKALMEALKRMGLKYKVSCETFIECAREIERQSDNFSMEVVKAVIYFLYKFISNLNFSEDQWEQLINIKFVPSENNQNPLYEELNGTLKFESFSMLCFQKYKEVCWSERPLFEKSVEPAYSFYYKRDPTIGMPTSIDIIKHWSYVVKNIKSIYLQTHSSEAKRVIQAIYEEMNKHVLKDKELRINNEEMLFLNGEDPFDEKCWVAGSKLAFGIQENAGGRDKVNDFLTSYRALLLRAGATEVDDDYINNYKKKIEKSSQKEELFKNLLNFINNGNKHHDITFIVGKESISANRYVLSGKLIIIFSFCEIFFSLINIY